jgi:hypothetical protein
MKTLLKMVFVAAVVVLFGAIGTAQATVSDQLTLNVWNLNPDGSQGSLYFTATRTIDEGGGESVLEEIDVHLVDPTGILDVNGPDKKAWLLEPGKDPIVFDHFDLLGNSMFSGTRSDQITIGMNQESEANADFNGVSLKATMNSDQDPGPNEGVIGYPELGSGLFSDVTGGIFSQADLDAFTALHYRVQILAASDVETSQVPEPGMLMLFGSGLLGLAFFGRKMLGK